MQRGMFGFPTQMAASRSRSGFEKLTAPSGDWIWPAGVTAATFWIQAPGGGGDQSVSDGVDGADSTITYNSVTTTAKAGKGGAFSGGPIVTGGDGGGGDFSVRGKTSLGIDGGSSFFGEGRTSLLAASQGGGGRGGISQGGGGGEMVRKRVVRVDGLNTVAYVNGAAGGSGSQAGAAGVILVEWTSPLKTA